MDWERTKTVFILAFLLLNAIFSFLLWVQPTYFDSSRYVSIEQIEAKVTELQYKNIEVTAEVPRRLQNLRMLTVRNPKSPGRAEAQIFLGQGIVQVPSSATPDSKRFLSDDGQVLVYNDGRLFYSSNLEPGGLGLSEAEARDMADTFLGETIGRPKDAVRGRVVRLDNGAWRVEFLQKWGKSTLETSTIWITVDSGGVLDMYYYWVEVVGYNGEKITSIPTTGALTVIADILPPGSTITDIHYSWYSNPVAAEQWRAYPVWVIETRDFKKYYVNAFTGDIEGSNNFRQENPALR